MSAIYQRLAQTLPERHAPGKNSFATDARAIRTWLAHLPMANPGACARLLISALREMNQLRVDPVQRLEALELLRGVVQQINTTLDKQSIGESFPLPPQKLAAGQLAQEFQYALAMGYCAVACDLCAPAGAVPFMKSKPTALALTRALQHLGAHLYKTYLLYYTPTPGVWQSLHDLFRFAQAIRLENKVVEDPLLGGVQVSVFLAYMHALLFALSNPYRYTQKENADIYTLTRVWAIYCEIREGRAPAGAIAIHVDSDQGPGYLLEEREIPDEGLWAFEISGLHRFLDGQLALLPPGISLMQFQLKRGVPLQTEVSFVQRLMSLWGCNSERTCSRLPAGHQLETVIGLHAVHYVLADKQDFETFLRKTRGVSMTLNERDRAATWTGGTNESNRVGSLRAQVLDQSLGGYRILWEKSLTVRAKVGEMLALSQLAEDGETQDWMIGITRWIRIERSGAIDAGVELLAGHAQPVALRSFDADGLPRAAVRGILLYPLTDDDGVTEDTILVPHLFDRSATEVELTRSAAPLALSTEPVVEMLKPVRVIDAGGVYLQITLMTPAAAAETDVAMESTGSAV